MNEGRGRRFRGAGRDGEGLRRAGREGYRRER